jgi:hypothetical protein
MLVKATIETNCCVCGDHVDGNVAVCHKTECRRAVQNARRQRVIDDAEIQELASKAFLSDFED